LIHDFAATRGQQQSQQTAEQGQIHQSDHGEEPGRDQRVGADADLSHMPIGN
jgi:hypothetical protein